jgi:S-adenosylmethionine:tRNA ribosyltransferase-isomerase
MKTSDFFFHLPAGLIAQYPPGERGQSRLMVLDRKSGAREHRMMRDLPGLLEKRTLLVFNNSRVRKARIQGRSKETGAKAEFLLLNRLARAPGVSGDGVFWRVMAQRAKRRHPGSRYLFDDDLAGEITAADGDYRVLRFSRPVDDAWLDLYGHIPLPPYIKRGDLETDSERYQTVYAQETGSVAAPTAGLHFTPELFEELEKAGMETAFITLHVGLGTFLPVRTENIEGHVMHGEIYSISETAAAMIEKAKSEGRKVLTVGTTSVRTLESAWHADLQAAPRGRLMRGEGETSIFIYPGYRFQVADQLFTNFHTPGSTLLMLVSAFADEKAEAITSAGTIASSGRELMLECYREAVEKGYRFFSYGDAMLIR